MNEIEEILDGSQSLSFVVGYWCDSFGSRLHWVKQAGLVNSSFPFLNDLLVVMKINFLY